MTREEMMQKVSQRERPSCCIDKVKADMQQRARPQLRDDFKPHPDDPRYKKDAGEYIKYDAGEVLGGGLMQDGKLHIQATIGRAGIQTYLTGAEMRAPGEVFSRDHLRSLQNLPVTIGHGSLEPKKSDIVGTVRNVNRDGNHIEATIEVTDPVAMRKVTKGLLSGFSLGYTSDDIVKNGETYQTNLRAYHLALLQTPGHSRCGTSCKILDLKVA